MAKVVYIITLVDLTLLLVTSVLMLIYLLSIIFVKRFHTTSNILTGNVCLAGIICTIYWVIDIVVSVFYPALLDDYIVLCILSQCFPTMFNCLTIYSLVIITINRFFTVVYPKKRLFQRKTWCFISIIVQWITAICVPIPQLVFDCQSCTYKTPLPHWINVYKLLVIVIIPSILKLVFNAMIFSFVRSSSKRVHTTTATAIAPVANLKHQHNRDMYLLKHMLFLLTVFVIGWAPVYLIAAIDPTDNLLLWVSLLLQMLPVNCGSIYSTTLFLSFYSLSVVVIIPSIVNILFNSLIFMSVRSSTRRINALATTTTKTSVTNTTHQDKRDIYLLKHIVFMFIVFISGWAPVYTVFIVVDFANPIGLWLTLLLQFLPALSLLITLIYLIPIILLRRFHTTTNILTGNYCIAGIICSGFWILYNVITEFYFTTFFQSYNACMVLAYFRLMVNSLLVYSLTMITINRYFTIKYPNKLLFKRKTWSIVSSIIPWIIAIVVSMPAIIFSLHNCETIYSTSFSLNFYSLCAVVIVPSIVNIIFNSLIFISVRSSTRRIKALTTTTTITVTSITHQDKRDTYLLKHIVFMFIVFISGWAPFENMP
ncbi:unnamed protein product [Adineta steineri]|uniref:G-protein coupled receptors family 1 profile domain-containing protein n=1 Tax=Adineta steineri TaxID=433720 RepID=A0A814W957_9BILA|nr:unnamed protein product [Adineta steineri]CAF1199293.1 unnamed protein product [Adineta steineri]